MIVDERAGGKGRQPPGCGEWQGLLPAVLIALLGY